MVMAILRQKIWTWSKLISLGNWKNETRRIETKKMMKMLLMIDKSKEKEMEKEMGRSDCFDDIDLNRTTNAMVNRTLMSHSTYTS
jgi:hypothetical protein